MHVVWRVSCRNRQGASSIARTHGPSNRHSGYAPPPLAGRAFSFGAKFPTQHESAMLASTDSELDDPNSSRLVCGKCNSALSKTKDLVFFKWLLHESRKGGIHLSSITDAPLEQLRSPDSDELEEEANYWKKHRLSCIKCDHHVGTRARVFASDKILFSAKQVAIQMPDNQSPMLSLSGYPSSLLGFSMWSELILMVESQPSLKESLQIRRVDHIRDATPARKELNTKLLLAKNLNRLLRIVDENYHEMSHVNICTALDRAAKFKAFEARAKDAVNTTPRFNISNKSEAPEDGLLDLPANVLMGGVVSQQQVATQKKRMQRLVDAVENVANFSIGAFNDGLTLSQVSSSLSQLGIGRPTILQPLAKQMLFLMDSTEKKIKLHEASVLATNIVHLSAKEVRSDEWVANLLQAVWKIWLDSEANSDLDPAVRAESLISLARAYVMAGFFDEELFRTVFAQVNAGVLDDLPLAPYKLKLWRSKMYEMHLDCELTNRPEEFRLSPAKAKKYKATFEEVQRQASSFRLRHLVGSALDQMTIEHVGSYAVEAGYSLDVAAPKLRIGIEINGPNCYQADEHVDSEQDDFVEDKPLGFVDLKARHLSQLGWTVIQIRADKFQQLATLEDRVKYLSMLFEVATNGQRQFKRKTGKKQESRLL